MNRMTERRYALMSAPQAVNSLTSYFGKITLEKVTITGSTAANMQSAVLAVKNQASMPGNVIAIKRINSQSPNPNTDEMGGWYLHTDANNTTPGASGYRYHQNTWSEALINTNYTAKITDGSTFEIVMLSYETRWKI